jgi:hypothetical protein
MSSTHTLTTVQTTATDEVLHFGVELRDCHACGQANLAGEACSCGFAPDHRGRRRAPRRRFDELVAPISFGEELAGLADAALSGRLSASRVLA